MRAVGREFYPILAAMLAAQLAACASYRPAPVDPSAGMRAFEARRLDEPALGAAVNRLIGAGTSQWPPAKLDRAQLLAVALVQNPRLSVTRAELRAAQAHTVTAGEIVNPDLTLQSEYARNDVHPWLYGLSVSWLLRSPERRRFERDIADLESSAANFELMERSWSLRRDLVAAVSAWELSRRRIERLDSLAASEDRLLALVGRRVEAGEDAPLDLLLARQSRMDAERERAESRVALNAAQAAVAGLLGLPPAALDGISVDWADWGKPPDIERRNWQTLREQALLSRSDLEAAIRDYASAEIRLQRAVARQYPELTLSPGYYWDHGIAKFPFDVGFTLPLNRNRGEIAEARAARAVAGGKLTALQAEIDGGIAAAERAESLARARVDAAELLYATSLRQAELATLSVRLGAAGAAERLGAQIVAARAELELLQAQAELQSARNAREDALHMPLTGPELALSPHWSTATAGSRP